MLSVDGEGMLLISLFLRWKVLLIFGTFMTSRRDVAAQRNVEVPLGLATLVSVGGSSIVMLGIAMIITAAVLIASFAVISVVCTGKYGYKAGTVIIGGGKGGWGRFGRGGHGGYNGYSYGRYNPGVVVTSGKGHWGAYKNGIYDRYYNPGYNYDKYNRNVVGHGKGGWGGYKRGVYGKYSGYGHNYGVNGQPVFVRSGRGGWDRYGNGAHDTLNGGIGHNVGYWGNAPSIFVTSGKETHDGGYGSWFDNGSGYATRNIPVVIVNEKTGNGGWG